MCQGESSPNVRVTISAEFIVCVKVFILRVGRVNGTIKHAMVKATTYQNIDEMKQALEYWYNLNPDLFIREPDMLRKLIFVNGEQCGET